MLVIVILCSFIYSYFYFILCVWDLCAIDPTNTPTIFHQCEYHASSRVHRLNTLPQIFHLTYSKIEIYQINFTYDHMILHIITCDFGTCPVKFLQGTYYESTILPTLHFQSILVPPHIAFTTAFQCQKLFLYPNHIFRTSIANWVGIESHHLTAFQHPHIT